MVNLMGGLFERHAVLAAPTPALQFAAMNFDMSLYEICSALFTGATLVLIGEEQRLDFDSLVAVLQREQVARLYLPTAMLQPFAHALLAAGIDLPALRKPEYRQQPVRFAAKAEIDARVGEELKKQPTAYWLERLREARIPCGPVNNFEQALGDAQVLSRDMVVEVPLKTGERVRMPGNPIKLSAADKGKAFTCPPALGENTRAVLGDLVGYSAEKLEALRAEGAIA
jgi:crotonobetainyl-CoA:carnitine CoA-transferase CaiB-like acyl-CoA transferase